MRKKLCAVVAALLVLLLLILGGLAFLSPRSAEWYASFVAQSGAILRQAAENPEQSPQMRWTLWRGGVEAVQWDGERAIFTLKGAPLEGHRYLILAPSGEYVPACLDWYDNWTPVEAVDAQRWEGGAMNRGYVELRDLGDGFYLEEASLPI